MSIEERAIARRKRARRRTALDIILFVLIFAGITTNIIYTQHLRAEVEGLRDCVVETRGKIADLSNEISQIDKYIVKDNFAATTTAYCPCAKCCGKATGITSTGTIATEGRTVAVDPSVIPYGTRLLIDGNIYIAEDCGGAIKGNKIDIYFNSHEDAKRYGYQIKEVAVLQNL